MAGPGRDRPLGLHQPTNETLVVTLGARYVL